MVASHHGTVMPPTGPLQVTKQSLPGSPSRSAVLLQCASYRQNQCIVARFRFITHAHDGTENWCAVQATPQEMGPMQFLAGSHKHDLGR